MRPEDNDMSEDSDTNEAPLPKAKKFSGKKIVVLIAVIVILSIGGGIGIMTQLGSDQEDSKENQEESEKAGDEKSKKSEKDGPESPSYKESGKYIELPPFMVNLKSSNNRRSLLRLTIILEMKNDDDGEYLKKRLPKVTDSFYIFLRELRIDDLSGSSGSYRLKEGLLRRANLALSPMNVQDVLFKEMLVQ